MATREEYKKIMAERKAKGKALREKKTYEAFRKKDDAEQVRRKKIAKNKKAAADRQAKGDASREQRRFKNFKRKDDATQLKRKRKVVKDSLAKETKKAKERTQRARGFLPSKTTTTTKKTTPGNVMPKPKRATDKGGRSAVPGTMRGKQVNTKMGPNMSKVTKVTAADRKKQKGGADNRSTMQKLFGASEEKRKMGRDMQKRAQASMGFNKGGSLKTPTNPGLKKLPTEVRNKMGFMNKGGKVKKMKHGGKCKIDGIAIRGRTRARTK